MIKHKKKQDASKLFGFCPQHITKSFSFRFDACLELRDANLLIMCCKIIPTISVMTRRLVFNVLTGFNLTQLANKLTCYTTLLKSVQITRKTSTNIQRYSDSWLFVHLVICIVGNRFDKLTRFE